MFVGGLMSSLRYLRIVGSDGVVFVVCSSSSCVNYTASFSELSIFDCPFDVL
jgi:hypothetical protein